MEKYGWNERQTYPPLYGVNYSIVWDVIKNKIPELYEQIIEVIGKE